MTITKHIIVLMLVFLGVSFTSSGRLFAHAEKIYYLKGKIGQRDLAIRMLCYDEMPTRHITYFFLTDKKDRYLAGNFKDSFWHFLPEVQPGKTYGKPAVTLKIAETVQEGWKGTWTDSSGKSWDIALKDINPDSIAAEFRDIPFINEIDPYESYRLANIHVTKTRTENKANGLACDWYLEKESGISFFRLRSINNRLQTDKINATLRSINLSLLQKHFSSKAGQTGTKVETALPYLTNELVSFKILSKSTLQTGAASQARQLLTFDMESGQQVDLERLICFEQGAAKPPPDDMYKVYKYRKAVFAPKVFQLLQELYPGKMKSDSCGINKAETWALPVWSLTDKGIAFDLMNSDQCNVLSWAIIPYEKLEPYLEEGYHLKAKK